MENYDETLPKEISSTLDFLKRRRKNSEDLPEDEQSYYDPDPYNESMHRFYRTGKYEYMKLFTEEGFRDMQLVLEFSKVAKDRNIDCRNDFLTVLQSLEMIINVISGEENQDLFNKFEALYQKMIKF
ncbi:hypothetical protein PIROE2DRAFT_14653 [Piromyces sp. E2]|nr:hypothetical protein PIROE2DRAFT_14653 [Piromyces sp. E2]|eukprot:OUM59750.1 hypothetical protein PIROE2DRAFT_14653 [Piromyces sp. E2]